MENLFESMNQLNEIQTLIDGSVRESEVLEYKRANGPFSDREKGEIAKDVSAMANSSGGLIVYGVATDADDKTKPNQIEKVHPKNIETLDRVINALIRPPIKGLRKKLVPADQPQVMLIDVPASEDPPHQSLHDKKYYRRSGTESVPMEHDLVALHFGRRLGPLLELKFQSLRPPTQFAGDPPFTDQSLVRIFVENLGRRVGRFVEVLLIFPGEDDLHIVTKQGPAVRIDQLYPRQQARQFTNNIGVFHPHLPMSILEFGFQFSQRFMLHHPDDPFVKWQIYADEMPPRIGSVTLRELGWVVPPPNSLHASSGG